MLTSHLADVTTYVWYGSAEVEAVGEDLVGPDLAVVLAGVEATLGPRARVGVELGVGAVERNGRLLAEIVALDLTLSEVGAVTPTNNMRTCLHFNTFKNNTYTKYRMEATGSLQIFI